MRVHSPLIEDVELSVNYIKPETDASKNYSFFLLDLSKKYKNAPALDSARKARNVPNPNFLY